MCDRDGRNLAAGHVEDDVPEPDEDGHRGELIRRLRRDLRVHAGRYDWLIRGVGRSLQQLLRRVVGGERQPNQQGRVFSPLTGSTAASTRHIQASPHDPMSDCMNNEFALTRIHPETVLALLASTSTADFFQTQKKNQLLWGTHILD